MAEVDDKILMKVENRIRDMINWVAVFEEEYDLPKEVVEKLRDKLEEIASLLK